jgi:hypothetical protein
VWTSAAVPSLPLLSTSYSASQHTHPHTAQSPALLNTHPSSHCSIPCTAQQAPILTLLNALHCSTGTHPQAQGQQQQQLLQAVGNSPIFLRLAGNKFEQTIIAVNGIFGAFLGESAKGKTSFVLYFSNDHSTKLCNTV